MNKHEIAQLKQTVVITAELANKTLSDDALQIYSDDLINYDLAKVLQAMAVYRKKGKFPSVNDIENEINPPIQTIDEARDASGRIIEAISRFGYIHPHEAKMFMGELAWLVVLRSGGWLSVCESVTDRNVGTHKAQFRDAAESLHKMAKAGRVDGPVLPGAATANILEFKTK